MSWVDFYSWWHLFKKKTPNKTKILLGNAFVKQIVKVSVNVQRIQSVPKNLFFWIQMAVRPWSWSIWEHQYRLVLLPGEHSASVCPASRALWKGYSWCRSHCIRRGHCQHHTSMMFPLEFSSKPASFLSQNKEDMQIKWTLQNILGANIKMTFLCPKLFMTSGEINGPKGLSL